MFWNAWTSLEKLETCIWNYSNFKTAVVYVSQEPKPGGCNSNYTPKQFVLNLKHSKTYVECLQKHIIFAYGLRELHLENIIMYEFGTLLVHLINFDRASP